MDYKKKYLKYKLKYLQAKNNLKGGMQAADRISVSDVNTEETKCVFFDPNNNIFESVAEAFNRPINHIDEVGWIGGPGGRFDSDWTFSDVKIEDGARLNVSFKTTIDEIIDDIIKLNPHLTRDVLISLIRVYEPDGLSHYRSIWWQRILILNAFLILLVHLLWTTTWVWKITNSPHTKRKFYEAHCG